jgi:hypothetical protein
VLEFSLFKGEHEPSQRLLVIVSFLFVTHILLRVLIEVELFHLVLVLRCSLVIWLKRIIGKCIILVLYLLLGQGSSATVGEGNYGGILRKLSAWHETLLIQCYIRIGILRIRVSCVWLGEGNAA